MFRIKVLVLFLFAAFAAALLFADGGAVPGARAFSNGPPAGYTHAPGELDCSDCHTTPAQSAGTIKLTAPQQYAPGQTYDITVTHASSDPARVRWGFQLTALDSADQKAGTLAPADDLTQVLTGQGRFPARQYVEHTQKGTFNGQQNGATWTFKWTAPAQDVGFVTFYVAGNQANGDHSSGGDNIYFTFASAAYQPPAPNPIDDTTFFVTQHYRDFLNREPDTPGLNFWVGEIESCNTDAQCREVKRINVSAAFFLSIEFQNTGYLVERMYKVAYGDRTEASTGLVVPVIRRPEFAADAPLISNNVVVGQGDWQTTLENNKTAYAQAFVQRQRFTDIYGALDATQFVDRLNQNAGGVLTEAERASLVDELARGINPVASRADVLRKVAENAELDRREKSRAFVLMEYFGYLRRNPDDAPEPGLNYAGWNFWLSKLNQFGGNFVEAEMVKAFLSSDEYRKRFVQ